MPPSAQLYLEHSPSVQRGKATVGTRDQRTRMRGAAQVLKVV
jgi:hypothetical protein